MQQTDKGQSTNDRNQPAQQGTTSGAIQKADKEHTKEAREEALEDIAHDPEYNNNDPYKDLDEGEAARARANERNSK